MTIVDTWRAIFPLGTGRHACVAAHVAGITYVVGGQREGGIHGKEEEVFKSVEAFDARWRHLPAMSKPLQHARYSPGCAVSADGRIFVVGGARKSKDEAPLASVEFFDTRDPDLGWQPASPLCVGLCGNYAGVIGKTLFVLGGSTGYWDGHYHSNDGRFYALDLNDPTSPWREVTDAKAADGSTFELMHGAAVVVGNRIIALGGRPPGLNSYSSSEIFTFDGVSLVKSPTKLKISRYGCAAAAMGEMVYVLGGLFENTIPGDSKSRNVYLSCCEAFSVSEVGEIAAADRPAAMGHRRYRFAAVAAGSAIYAIGGSVEPKPADDGYYHPYADLVESLSIG